MIAGMTYLSPRQVRHERHELPPAAAPSRAGIHLETVEATIAQDDLVRRFVRATEILQLGAERRVQALQAERHQVTS